jgi:hypothetical protein
MRILSPLQKHTGRTSMAENQQKPDDQGQRRQDPSQNPPMTQPDTGKEDPNKDRKAGDEKRQGENPNRDTPGQNR